MQSFRIFPTNSESTDSKALCSWKIKEQLFFGIVDLTTGKWNKLQLNINDENDDCKISVGLDGFAIAQGKKLFCFNNMGNRWRYVHIIKVESRV